MGGVLFSEVCERETKREKRQCFCCACVWLKSCVLGGRGSQRSETAVECITHSVRLIRCSFLEAVNG